MLVYGRILRNDGHDNPYPVKGWEVIGVDPDVKVSRTEAFDMARKLAESRIRLR